MKHRGPRRLATLVRPTLVSMLLLHATGCGCGASPERVAQPLSPQPSGTLAAGSGAPPSGSVLPAATPLDPDQLRPLLEDPRLALVRAAKDKGDTAAAAQAMQEALAQSRPDGFERLRWAFLLGSLLRDAGDATGAEAAFMLASHDERWPLREYARLEAASALATAGKHAEAIALATAVAPGLPISTRARVVLADALEQSGEVERSAQLWDQHLAEAPSGPRWAHGAVRVASHLLREPRDAQRTTRALTLARRVLSESPTSSIAGHAAQLEQAALTAMTPGERSAAAPWPVELRVRRAEALFSADRRKQALDAVDDILKSMTTEQRKARVACDAAFLRAAVLERDRKKRPQAADAYGAAMVACKDHPDKLVRALYAGAKLSARAGRPAEALVRYGRVEKEFSTHRLADDARLKTAQTVLGMGDKARFERLLGSMAEDYPDGDMVEDGLFALALHHIDDGNWEAAIPPLLESTRVRPKEKRYWEAGRARYFLARALAETGQEQQADEQLRRVILEHPFSYYMLLSYTRVHNASPERAQALLSEGESAGPAAVEAPPLPPKLGGSAFERALELLMLGEIEAARAEVRSLGLTTQDGDALWRMASLYARAGAEVIAHQVARSRSEEWSGAYPQGKWRTAWELAYPRPHLGLVEQHTTAFGLPVPIAYGIMREESAFDAGAVSSADAYGLMQLIMPTAQSVARSLKIQVDPEALTRPEVNIQLGCKLLASLRSMFPTAPQLAIPSYNAGAGATKRWLRERPDAPFDLWVEHIDYDETRSYMKRVLSTVAVYGYLYDSGQLDSALRLPLTVSSAI